MIEIKFTGDAAESHAEMVEYLKKVRFDTTEGVRSTALDHPDNVTKQVIYEPVRSTTDHKEVYIVTIVNDTLPVACTCKDFHYSIRKKRERGDRTPIHACKHMKMARARHKRY